MTTIIAIAVLAAVVGICVALGRAREKLAARQYIEQALSQATISETRRQAEEEQHARSEKAAELAATIEKHSEDEIPTARIASRWRRLRVVRDDQDGDH